ncbi:MAG: TadE/TadG family type IV pilus assembly protein [Actinomycetota bacterium]
MNRRLFLPRRQRPRANERGAVLVEFALVATLLVTLVVGVLEVGSAWSDYQSLNQASRSGARVASQVGLQGEADQQALLAVESALGPLGNSVSRIVIYEAGADGAMPAACQTATAGYNGTANCNVYDATSLANLTTPGWWGTGTSCGTADGNWCAPTERSDDLSDATFVGVVVEVERNYLTGLFGGGTQSMSEITVMRVEPEIE